mmetsp:Transcript_25029/g.83222  ORF Transcript_25029/g.83222 Transcript_25029/m.83222 type:complete len:245 (-) Transcript_25029:256-990(-)
MTFLRVCVTALLASLAAATRCLPSCGVRAAVCAPRVRVAASAALGEDGAAAAWYSDEADGAAAAEPAAASQQAAAAADAVDGAVPDTAPAAASPSELPTLPSEPAEPEGPPTQLLETSDLVNTRWELLVVPREEGWLPSDDFLAEVTLLADGSVVWGGAVGGPGTGGRWTLNGETLEIIRTTPLGLVSGRDYYMSNALAEVTSGLQLALRGVIRSYNAIYPVAVVADFVAVRQSGRFVRDSGED